MFSNHQPILSEDDATLQEEVPEAIDDSETIDDAPISDDSGATTNAAASASASSENTVDADSTADETGEVAEEVPPSDNGLFCGRGEFPWRKGAVYPGRMHRLVQLELQAEKLSVQHYYSNYWRGYTEALQRDIDFKLDGDLYDFNRATQFIPTLRRNPENRAEIIADFPTDPGQAVTLTKETCETTDYTDELATIRSR